MAGSSPDHTARLDPAQYIKKREKQDKSGPPAQLAQTVLAKGVSGKTDPYALSMYFISSYFDIWPNKPRFDIRKETKRELTGEAEI